MLQPVDISGGQVSGVDSLSPAASFVRNWDIDEAGINRMRPALAAYSLATFTTDKIIGFEHWQDKIIAVTQAADVTKKMWYITDSVPDNAHALSDTTAATQVPGVDPTRRAVFAAGATFVYVTAGGAIQRWGPSLALSQALTNSPRCTHVASIGQRLVVNDLDSPLTFRWSDLGEGVWTSWPAANSTEADARPDQVVALYENANELFVFGESTLQTYQVGADPTLPFDQVATINTGIGARYCAIRLDEQFVWLDDRLRIVMSDGRQVEELSAAIGADLRGLSSVTDAWGYREEIGQQSRLVFRFPTAKRTFVYDLKGKKWGERDYYLAPFSADWPVGAYVYRAFDNAHVVGSTLSTGGAMKLDSTIRADLSGPLVCDRITGWQDFGTNNRKRSAYLMLTMRRGTAAEGATAGSLEVRVQQDDSAWSDWYQVSVGNPSDYQHTQKLFVGGVFRRRRYHLRYSQSDDISIVSLQDDVTDLEAQQEAA